MKLTSVVFILVLIMQCLNSSAQTLYVPGGTVASASGSTPVGRVGIGITGPLSTLHANNQDGQSSLSLTSSISYGAILKLERFNSAGNHYAFETGAGSNDDLRLYINNNWSTPLMAFKSSGFVGIGIANPMSSFHLAGASASHTYINIDKAGNSNEGGVLFSKAGTTLFYLFNDDIDNALKIQASGIAGEADATPRMQFPLLNKNIYMAESGGNVGIGTNNPGSFKLAVEGKIGAREINVTTTTPWPDYVFEKDYNLPTLAEVESYINQNKHLPEVPAAKEMEKNGVNLGEMNMLLLKKVEELTLYVIELKKENDEQRKRSEDQQLEIESIKVKMK
jgi:hypothetical protein